LMERLIAERRPDHADSAELSFYLGAIAAHQSQFDKAEQCFARATALDGSWSDRVAACRLQLGDQYLRYSQEWRASDSGVARRMLFKGFRINPVHPELRSLLVDEMRKLGIGQARIEFSLVDKIMMWAADLKPFSGFIMACLLVVNLAMLLLNFFLIYRLRRRNKNV